ncbi:MAG: response regulator [Chitinispirillales bacterium]|jgi:putative nucleotidyltransferase with HDIG domain|nr:response regulator [Chitinispirillales bacterium]
MSAIGTNIILVVEDDKQLLSSVSVFLTSSGFKVISAADGVEALKMLEQITPDLIISDVQMPNMDGIEFLGELKRSKRDIPVIITTGYPDIDTAIKSIQNGASDYLTKPYHYDALLGKVHAVIKSNNIKKENVVLSFIGTYSETLMGLVEKTAIIKCLFDTVQKNFLIDFIGFLMPQKRGCEFLYWSRGEFKEEFIEQIRAKAADEYNRVTNSNVALKKITNKYLDIKCETKGEVEYPFVFEHIMQMSWEDMNFGCLVFGAGGEFRDPHEKIALLSSLTSQTRIALTNSKLYTDMKENYIRTIKALAIAVDAKDRYTHGHSENVQHYAEEIALEMNVDEKLAGIIRDAALLHDIGKIGIPGNILNKPGPLTHEEFNGIMKDHSALGANIVKDVPFLKELYKLILHHHEHYDGGGYPHGLSGEDIPMGARIIHLADAFEAMTSTRPYRSSLGKEEAIRRLLKDRGKQFDPQVVDAFMCIVKRKGWAEEEQNLELRT